jgi:hypothetical protein
MQVDVWKLTLLYRLASSSGHVSIDRSKQSYGLVREEDWNGTEEYV